MTRVLLTGASGFVATHVLDNLLQRGHSVVATVRSQEKAASVRGTFPTYGKDKLDFAIVENIAQDGAFDDVVISDPPFQAVIHTASPFHFRVTDVQKQLLDPAVAGTIGILKSIHEKASTIERVVITSSFAAMVDPSKGIGPEIVYSESNWSPITLDQALQNPGNGYRASKAFAEKAAWDFVRQETPNFTVTTICPPLVMGPVAHQLTSLNDLNTSNQIIAQFMQGKAKDEIPNHVSFFWADVRDVALCHVLAMEKPEAANLRFFTTAGHYSNREIAEIITRNFPEYADGLPTKDTTGGNYPKGGVYGYNNDRSVDILGIKFRPLEESIMETVKSLQTVGS